jgi:membrane fusion protein (multidrug efflux system)
VRPAEHSDAPAGTRPAAAPVPDASPAGATAPEPPARLRAPARRGTARRALVRFVLLGVVPVAAVAGGVGLWLQGGRFAETDNAYAKADKVPVAAEVSGTVRAVLVQDNQAVRAGQPLLRLDDAPLRVSLARAEARVAQARTDVAALKAGYRAKQAEIALARTRHEFARRDEARQADLAARQFISASRLDEARHASELAGQQVFAIEQELARIGEALGGGPSVPTDRHPSVLAATAELMQARLDLSRTEIRAPVDGTVSRPPRPGQFVGAGTTALALVASAAPWIEANFSETELTWLRAGQPVTVRIDTYPDIVWRGTVESLSPATGAEFAILPAQNASGNWVKVAQRVPVRIRVEPPEGAPPLRAGLSAHVRVDTGHRRRLADLLP